MTYKKIHFVGIKGVGMTPLAIIAKEADFIVSGCDIEGEFITDEPLKKVGIVPSIGFVKDHIEDVDLVITTGAHGGFNNREVKEARQQGIKVLTQGEAVGVFMEGSIFGRHFTGISIAGTHGKTTTTAMVATILKENGLDPSFLIGTSDVPSLGAPGHYGKGKYFVAEADEYATEPSFNKKAKFLWQRPRIAIITNIEFDHPDVYSSINDVRNAFLKFAKQLPKDGVLITCGDSKEVRKVLKDYRGRRIRYGFSKENDFVIGEIKYTGHSGLSRISLYHEENGKRFWSRYAPQNDDEKRNGLLEFRLTRKHEDLGNFKLNVFGEHNALNATAAIITSITLGLPINGIKKSLLKFTGSKRRAEYIGQLLSGTLVFDDYAHHPTKIKATLAAFRKRFPNSKIVCIFEPHTYSRTKSLFEQFVRSFDYADTVIITNIYASLREKKDPTVSSEQLADAIRRSPRRSPFGHLRGGTVFLPKLTDVVKYIVKKKYGKDTIIITMGAGDVYKIGEILMDKQNPKSQILNPK